ncbi:MAG: InlB B-repeat-containing protein [Prevotellaceae bacterium]|jgi:uncharacterized repeat protein (TIGR02543 family)|nr:InlB B-repeat-containing protein [Prevotellaceae bacterium]
MKKMLSMLLFATVLLGFTSCGPKTFTVTFDVQGGSAVAPITKVEGGFTITEPAVPTRTGYDFEGWFKEPTFVTEWNFATDVVNADLTLYAKWDEKSDKVGLFVTWYWGNSNSQNMHNFELRLCADGVFVDGVFRGAGEAYIFNLYAPSAEPAQEKGYIIPEGTYNYDVYNTNEKFTFSKYASGIFRANNAGEGGTKNPTTFNVNYTEGTVTITKRANGDYVLKVAVTGDDGKTYRLRYQGDLRGHSRDFNKESIAITTNLTKSYSVHTSSNYHDTYEMGADYVDFLIRGNNEFLRLAFLLTPNSETLPAGELSIIKHTTQFSAVPFVEASGGWPSGGEQPSTFKAGNDIYFLQSGTVKIVAVADNPATEDVNEAATSTVTVTAKSYFGSTINVTYTGLLTTRTSNP